MRGGAVLAAGVLTLAAAFTGPALAECVVKPILQLPVTMSGRQAIVKLKINGVDEPFVVDSGAFYSVMSDAKVSELKLPRKFVSINYRIQGVGGSDGNTGMTNVKSVTLGGATFSNVEFFISSFPEEILGQNVLGVADVEYDFSNGALRLFEPQGCSGESLAYWAKDGASIVSIRPRDAENPHTIGQAYVNGARISVIFDTGAGASVLTTEAAHKAGIALDGPDVRLLGHTMGIGPGAVKTWSVPASSFKIGDEEIRNTRLEVGDISSEQLGADMLLGADFFLSHRVYVSGLQRKLYFTYNGGPVFMIDAASQVAVSAESSQKSATDDTAEEPKSAEGYLRRGAAFLSRREYDSAIADFDKAVALAPENPNAFYQRALAHAQYKQAEQAMTDIDQSLKLDPKNTDALGLRARLRMANNDPLASTDIDKAVEILPLEADAHLQMAFLYVEAGAFQPAIAQFGVWTAAHHGDPRTVGALNGRCWSRALLGRDLNRALEDCDRALAAAPGSADIIDSRGLVRLRLGDNDLAIADYNAALAIDPKIAWSLYGRGLAEKRKGLAAQGAADMAAAVAINPKLPDDAKRYGVLAAGAGG